MWAAFEHTLHDPAAAAVPFFVLFMLIEMTAVSAERDHAHDAQRST